jgi:hypothetical protein
MDWGQVALFIVVIAVLYLVGRFLWARGYAGSGGNGGNGNGDGDGGGDGGD